MLRYEFICKYKFEFVFNGLILIFLISKWHKWKIKTFCEWKSEYWLILKNQNFVMTSVLDTNVPFSKGEFGELKNLINHLFFNSTYFNVVYRYTSWKYKYLGIKNKKWPNHLFNRIFFFFFLSLIDSKEASL